jgi:prefoldin subunit 5
VSEYECTEHLLDEIQRLRESNFQLREGAEELKQRIKRLEEALHRIANADYRGNRSTESQIAFEALKEAHP